MRIVIIRGQLCPCPVRSYASSSLRRVDPFNGRTVIEAALGNVCTGEIVGRSMVVLYLVD